MKTWSELPYKQKIVWRIRLMWAAVILLLVFMVVVGEMGGGDSRVQTDLAETMSRLLYFGGLIYLGVRIYRNKQLLKNRLMLKEQALAEHDEGARALHQRSGGAVMDVMLLILYLATMVSSLYNMPAFYMAYGLLAAAVILKGSAYFAGKYGLIRC